MGRRGGILLGYFFGPRRLDLTKLDDLAAYRPDEAILVCRFGDLDLLEGRWPIVGASEPWKRADWPMPEFRSGGLVGTYVRVRYPDDDPNGRPILARIGKDEYDTLPDDGVYGAGGVEIVLTKLLGGQVPPMPERPADDDGLVEIDHYLYFPGKEAAEGVAARLQAQGYQVVVRQSDYFEREDGTPDWLVLAGKRVPPEFDDLDDMEEQMEALAKEAGGEYDGYERELPRRRSERGQ